MLSVSDWGLNFLQNPHITAVCPVHVFNNFSNKLHTLKKPSQCPPPGTDQVYNVTAIVLNNPSTHEVS